MRRLWCLLLIPTLAGCALDDEYQAPVAYPPAYAGSSCTPPVANACSGGYRPTSPMYASPAAYVQTAEPPR
jgi:hypothetical protein